MKKYILGSIYIYGSTILSTLAGAIRLFLIAKYLSPQSFGYWNIILTIFGYFNFSHFGITDGLIKKSSSLNQKEYLLSSYYNYSNNAVLFLNIILNIVFMIFFINFFDSNITNIFSLAIPFIFLNIVYQFFITSISVLRIEENFYHHGLATILPNFTSLIIVFTLYFFKILNIENLLYTLSMSYLVAFLFAKSFSRWTISFLLDFKQIKSFFIIGFPIISSAFIFNLFLTFDKWIILKYFDAYELGIFSFPQNIARIALLAGTSLSYVFYTKFIKDFSQNNFAGNLKQFNNSINLLSLISLFLIIICYYLYPIFIKIFFPKYLESIHYIGPLLLNVYYLSLYSLIANFLIAINRVNIIFIILIPFFIVDIILQVSIALIFENIVAIILARSISVMAIVVFMLRFIYKYFFKYKKIFIKIANIFIFIFLFLSIELSIEYSLFINNYKIFVRLIFILLFTYNSIKTIRALYHENE